MMSHHFKCTAKLLSARLHAFLCCSNFEQCETVCKKGPYQKHQFGHESDTCVGVTENVEQKSVLEK